MKINVLILFFVCLFFIAFSCNKQSKEKNSFTRDSLSVVNTDTLTTDLNSLSGTYIGEISCDDCEKVELSLKDNNDYSLLIHLADEENSRSNTTLLNGKYTLDAKDSIITLDQDHFKFLKQKNKLYYLFENSLKKDENEILIKQ